MKLAVAPSTNLNNNNVAWSTTKLMKFGLVIVLQLLCFESFLQIRFLLTATPVDIANQWIPSVFAQEDSTDADASSTIEKERPTTPRSLLLLRPSSDYSGPGRAFPLYNYSFPCYKDDEAWKWQHQIRQKQLIPTTKGILFNRIMKSASSTSAGLVLRMAIKYGKQTYPESPANTACQFRAVYHKSSTDLGYGKRDPTQSFLLTFLRDPVKRATSQFFHFAVSRNHYQPNDENFKLYLQRNISSNYYTRTLKLDSPHVYMNNHNATKLKEISFKTVQSILDGYDFVGVQEFMDESLVVLKMILGLDLTDILYVSSKSQGSFDDLCSYIVPTFVSPGMKEYFNSSVFQERFSVDQILYTAAVRSLHVTIHNSLGLAEFNQELQQYRRAKELVSSYCPPAPVCDAAGRKSGKNANCLQWDLGCGYKCVESPEFRALLANASLITAL